MPFNQKIATIMGLALMAVASPIQSTHLSFARAQPSRNETKTLFEPTMYQIFPSVPSQSGPSVTQLEVQRSDNTSALENVAIFEGIPADAKTCTLGWVQADKAERTKFTVTGNGLLAIQQLPRAPEGDVSWENIAPITDEAVEQGKPLLHPDTTFWPDVNTATVHIAGPVDCAETIYLKVSVDDRATDGDVYLGQDAKNGLTIEVR